MYGGNYIGDIVIDDVLIFVSFCFVIILIFVVFMVIIFVVFFKIVVDCDFELGFCFWN